MRVSFESLLKSRGERDDPELLEQAEDRAAALVRLCEHGLSCLEKHVVLRVLRHLFCHVGIADRRLRSLDVLGSRRQVAARVGQAALDGTNRRLLVEGFLHSVVKNVDGSICLDLRGDIQRLAIFALQDSFGTACNVTGDGALTLILTGYCEQHGLAEQTNIGVDL